MDNREGRYGEFELYESVPYWEYYVACHPLLFSALYCVPLFYLFWSRS